MWLGTRYINESLNKINSFLQTALRHAIRPIEEQNTAVSIPELLYRFHSREVALHCGLSLHNSRQTIYKPQRARGGTWCRASFLITLILP